MEGSFLLDITRLIGNFDESKNDILPSKTDLKYSLLRTEFIH